MGFVSLDFLHHRLKGLFSLRKIVLSRIDIRGNQIIVFIFLFELQSLFYAHCGAIKIIVLGTL